MTVVIALTDLVATTSFLVDSVDPIAFDMASSVIKQGTSDARGTACIVMSVRLKAILSFTRYPSCRPSKDTIP